MSNDASSDNLSARSAHDCREPTGGRVAWALISELWQRTRCRAVRRKDCGTSKKAKAQEGNQRALLMAGRAVNFTLG
jgi:hypothetical protein